MDPAKRVKLLWDFEQYELDKVYYLRLGVGDTFTISQAWELNAVSHEVAYCSGGGTSECGWLGMIDADMRRSLGGSK